MVLKGIVVKIKKTGRKKRDRRGILWEECIFTVKITKLSRREVGKTIPRELLGKEVKVVRWCCHDWHYKLNVETTLNMDEVVV